MVFVNNLTMYGKCKQKHVTWRGAAFVGGVKK